MDLKVRKPDGKILTPKVDMHYNVGMLKVILKQMGAGKVSIQEIVFGDRYLENWQKLIDINLSDTSILDLKYQGKGGAAQKRQRLSTDISSFSVQVGDPLQVQAVFGLNLAPLPEAIPTFPPDILMAFIEKAGKEKNMPRLITWSLERSTIMIELEKWHDMAGKFVEERYEIAKHVMQMKYDQSFEASYLGDGGRWNIEKLRLDLASEKGGRTALAAAML